MHCWGERKLGRWLVGVIAILHLICSLTVGFICGIYLSGNLVLVPECVAFELQLTSILCACAHTKSPPASNACIRLVDFSP